VSLLVSEVVELTRRQTNDDLSVENPNSRGNRARVAHRSLALFSDVEIYGCRKSLHDDGRFQRDDVAMVFECVGDFFVDDDGGVAKVSNDTGSVISDREFIDRDTVE
jgi:hypothetical protein